MVIYEANENEQNAFKLQPLKWNLPMKLPIRLAMGSYRKACAILMVIIKGPSPLLLLQMVHIIDYWENK